MATTTTTPARRLGDLSTAELLERAASETQGLADLARSIADGTNTASPDMTRLLIDAYDGSIRASLAVAQMQEEARTTAAALAASNDPLAHLLTA